MSAPRPARATAPRRFTSAVLTGGVLLAALCFVVAGAAEILGAEAGSGEMTDFAAILDGLADMTPWAWAAAGAYLVVITPVAGLLATVAEYWSVDDRRAVGLAAAVLLVLALSVVVAIMG